MSNDFYSVLELSPTASPDEIKKSYRKLSLKYHPDKNNGDDVMFKSINEAYSILSDENEKRKYDMERQSPFGNHSQGSPFPQGAGQMPEIFKMFFNGGMGGVNGGWQPGGGGHPMRNIRVFQNGQPVNINNLISLLLL